MKSFIKITTIWLVINFSSGLFGGIVLGPKWNRIAQHYGGSLVGTLSVELRRISDNAQVPIGHMTFPITTTVNFGVNNPWVVANQYIKVMYDCNYPCWGIKIITDNNNPVNIGGVEPKWGKGLDVQWGKKDVDDDNNGIKDDWPEHGWAGSDDLANYGGLVNIDKKDNPTYRADLGWQIRIDWWSVGNVVGIKPVNPHDTPDFDYNTPGNDPEAIKDDWKSNWAYIGDKGNTGYIPDSIITGWTEDGEAMYNYDLAIFGDGTSAGLAQHPPAPDGPDDGTEPDPKPADEDGDVAVYIAARFCSKDYTLNPNNPVDFILPYGNYETTIYLEISFE